MAVFRLLLVILDVLFIILCMIECSGDLEASLFSSSLKNEMFYNRSWQGIGTKQFIPILNDYLIWYREKRIKLSLHGLSPIEYRRKLGLI